MKREKLLKVVIAGGGTAGWMTAAALSKMLGNHVSVTLVESDDIGTVGVGEATIPTMQSFHQLLQIDEKEFMRETQATFKLGIQFENWGDNNEKYFHSFGETGKEFWAGQFQHLWLRGLSEGLNYTFGDFSPELQAAMQNRFAITQKPRMGYAYHLDATLYAKYLRKISEAIGLTRIEGKIQHVELNPDDGHIAALALASGERVEGDLFIDCTGFRALLIGDALHTQYQDWSNFFICDRAVATQTRSVGEAIPYTRSIAHQAGWQWRIPLQHRVGNGLVYSSQHLADDDAIKLLLDNIEGERINEPRVIKFRPGHRAKVWNKNCVAIGLSSGFIEPLESTSIHLISSTIIRLMRMIPLSGLNQFDVDEFNRQALSELDVIRDFIVLHYKVTRRNDSDFWRYCRDMEIPDSLKARLDIYKDSGRLYWHADELFTVNSWNQVMLGQGILPRGYHPVADAMNSEELKNYFESYTKGVSAFVQTLPKHHAFVESYCAVKSS
ncbi:tryptophan halogenase family protein [Teredinibacter waterburyi]|uniref:tryptophan halogenase family protein n=1 Tax=Teredinibacter waterburyi TaxID=1500538 RepID=UPI00165F4538|nr:tryptophan halogenase family protein [Teredinibacter waterburyi]